MNIVFDSGLLEKYNSIWDKVSADIKNEFDSYPVYNKQFLKTRMKSYSDEATNFLRQVLIILV